MGVCLFTTYIQKNIFFMIYGLKIDYKFMHRIAQVCLQARKKPYNKDYDSEALQF